MNNRYVGAVKRGKVISIPATIRRFADQAMSLVLGLPSYNAYVAHVGSAHPEQRVMSREQFYRNRHTARYTGVRGRCC